MVFPKSIHSTYTLPIVRPTHTVNMWFSHKSALKLCYTFHATFCRNTSYICYSNYFMQLLESSPPPDNSSHTPLSLLSHGPCTPYVIIVSYVPPSQAYFNSALSQTYDHPPFTFPVPSPLCLILCKSTETPSQHNLCHVLHCFPHYVFATIPTIPSTLPLYLSMVCTP